jgi:hypothetical protein
MDLLNQESIDQFRAAMRSVTDTFHRTPVVLVRKDGGETELLCGLAPDEVGSVGEVHGELYVREERQESVERWVLSFNRDYLVEKGLINLEEEESRQMLITLEDRVLLKGKRFGIVRVTDKGVFRGVPVLVKLTIVR